ncbi:MAG: DNA-directed RNA polymerase subunit alpha [bacterium]
MLTVVDNLNAGLLAIEPNYGRFFINNLPYGMGITLGNSLRRILLSYIQGAAIFYVKINNALHEYEVINGVKEDIIEIILNLKKVRFKYRASSEWEKVFINFTGPGVVKAKEIRCPAMVEVVNPDQYIATVNTNITLAIEAGVKLGYGYIPAEEQVLPEESIGYIKVDSIFSPIEKVNYYVENERNENNQLTDKLYIEIYTDGTVSPKEALIKALNILKAYVESILKGYASESEIVSEKGLFSEPLSSKEKDLMNKNIKDLGLSSRTLNSLRRMGINTLGDLLKYTEDDLITIRNLGGKSIQEIKDKLKEYGLSLRES